MKRFYIVTIVMCLLLALFYLYGLSVDNNPTLSRPAPVAQAKLP